MPTVQNKNNRKVLTFEDKIKNPNNQVLHNLSELLETHWLITSNFVL